MWFSILVRKLFRRGNFIGKEQLKTRVLEFIDYFNRTLAKPFKWTYRLGLRRMMAFRDLFGQVS